MGLPMAAQPGFKLQAGIYSAGFFPPPFEGNKIFLPPPPSPAAQTMQSSGRSCAVSCSGAKAPVRSAHCELTR